MESTGQRADDLAMEYGAYLMDWLTVKTGFHQVRQLLVGPLDAVAALS